MAFNSKIFIKGQKEPIIVSFNSAKVVQERVSNQSVSKEDWIKIGNEVFTKGSIGRVSAIPDTSDSREKKAIWLIVDITRNRIWQNPYQTYVEAKNEYDLQIMGLPEEKKLLAEKYWQIEQRFIFS